MMLCGRFLTHNSNDLVACYKDDYQTQKSSFGTTIQETLIQDIGIRIVSSNVINRSIKTKHVLDLF